MINPLAYYTTERITIETPSGEWVPVNYDLLVSGWEGRGSWDSLLEQNPTTFTKALSQRLRCNVSVEKKTQITARFE